MLNQGEVVQIEAEFEGGTVATPIWLWIQRPNTVVSQPPIEMQKVSDSLYRAEYLCSDAGVYKYRIETSEPQIVDENIFSAQPTRLIKFSVGGDTFQILNENDDILVMQFSDSLIADEDPETITLELPEATIESETDETLTVNL
jgi:hypothetical protein